MRQRTLGRTGLEVSALGFGTVEIGLDYGIRVPGEYGRPDEATAVRLLRDAVDAGITFYDTAPGYGEAERILGVALSGDTDCVIATKVPVLLGDDGERLRGRALRDAIRRSIAGSSRALKRPVLDVLQIHNATVDLLSEGEVTEALLAAREAGEAQFLGATVYSEADAMAVIEAGCYDVLQIQYSVLDQRASAVVFPAVRAAGVAIVARSALLKGVLTRKALSLPDGMRPLRDSATAVMRDIAGSWDALPQAALRFSLSSEDVSVVLAGIRTSDELAVAIQAEAAGVLPTVALEAAGAHGLSDPRLLDPSEWPGV